MAMVPVSIQTLVVAASGGPSVLVLTPVADATSPGASRVVPIWIGPAEASQLGMALEGTRLGRPLSHDLMLDALSHLKATVERAEITEVQGKTFIARLVLRTDGESISLDARPSDAVALALRQGAPLFMEEHVLDAASYPFIFNKDVTNEEELDAFREFVQSLSPKDFED